MKNKNKEIVSIIIPTWNNPEYLRACITSVIRNGTSEGLFHIYIVNNGDKESLNWIPENPYITIIQMKYNARWEGGIAAGVKKAKGEFVCFLNDDAYIPPTSRLWLNQLLQHFKDPKVAAVGPSSNVVMGFQNIFIDVPFHIYEAKFLIGFCVLMRKKYFEKIGGMDCDLPGGDDFDWSIRFRQNGYKLIADRSVFVFHHGFKTGERINGTADKVGGWNSYEFKEKVDWALIKKHGFKTWWDVIRGAYEMPKIADGEHWEDTEAIEIKKIVGTKGKILDLGCGGNKTIPQAIGVDIIPVDEFIETLKPGTKSGADVNADVSKPLPFEKNSVDTIIARHILEHMLDPIEVLQNWKQVLKPNGKIVIAVPNQILASTIPMNIEHVHAYTPDFLKHLFETNGFELIEEIDPKNGVSFIMVAKLK